MIHRTRTRNSLGGAYPYSFSPKSQSRLFRRYLIICNHYPLGGGCRSPVGRRPAGAPWDKLAASPLSGRTRAWEAVREVRSCTDRVSRFRGCLGRGLGRNIFGSDSVGHCPAGRAYCRDGGERPLGVGAPQVDRKPFPRTPVGRQRQPYYLLRDHMEDWKVGGSLRPARSACCCNSSQSGRFFVGKRSAGTSAQRTGIPLKVKPGETRACEVNTIRELNSFYRTGDVASKFGCPASGSCGFQRSLSDELIKGGR